MNSTRGVALAVALALCVSVAHAAEPAPSSECKIKQFGTVDLTPTDDGVLLPVTLNGQPASWC